MKILAITSEAPWPLNSGGHLRSFHLLRELSQHTSLRIIIPSAAGPDGAIQALKNQRLDIIPVSNCTRKSYKEAGKLLQSLVQREPYVFFGRHFWPAVSDEIQRQIEIDEPDLIYFDHMDSYLYRNAIGKIPFVVDMHNIYSMISQRLAEEDTNLARRSYLMHETNLLRKKEQQLAQSAQAVFAVSESEQRHFTMLGAKATFMIPNGVNCELFAKETSDITATKTKHPEILFVGDLSWCPNVRAALFLANKVFPKVCSHHPEAKLTIVGRNPLPEILALHGQPGIELVANAPDVVPYFHKATMLAVPLLSGGGTRLKILEAFAAELPVVSTPVGSEGIDAINEIHLKICECENFVEAICQIIERPDLAKDYSAQALALVEKKYDWQSVGLELVQSIQRIVRETLPVVSTPGSVPPLPEPRFGDYRPI